MIPSALHIPTISTSVTGRMPDSINIVRRSSLHEYLEQSVIESLIRCAPHPQAALLLLVLWRAGLRISEALALEVSDLSLGSESPTLRVRQGKGGRSRLVPALQQKSSISATFASDSRLLQQNAILFQKSRGGEC